MASTKIKMKTKHKNQIILIKSMKKMFLTELKN